MKTEFTQEITPIPGAKIAIIHSKWYPECISGLLNACLPKLKQAGVEDVAVHALPGCYELPLAARHLLLQQPDLDAIIAFGIIVKGDTYHFDMILSECTTGFNQVMHEFNCPIINEVLPVVKLEDAQARSGDTPHNKGIDAALAATTLISWRRSVSNKKK